jgi:hypothetical protein
VFSHDCGVFAFASPGARSKLCRAWELPLPKNVESGFRSSGLSPHQQPEDNPTGLARPAPPARAAYNSVWMETMTSAEKLLARKQKLLERLQDDPGPNERDEIGRQIEKIDAALDLLEKKVSTMSRDQ